jgi:hypothetical protein
VQSGRCEFELRTGRELVTPMENRVWETDNILNCHICTHLLILSTHSRLTKRRRLWNKRESLPINISALKRHDTLTLLSHT